MILLAMEISEDTCKQILDCLSMKFTGMPSQVMYINKNHMHATILFGSWSLLDNDANVVCVHLQEDSACIYKHMFEDIMSKHNVYVWSHIYKRKMQVISPSTSIEQLIIESQLASAASMQNGDT